MFCENSVMPTEQPFDIPVRINPNIYILSFVENVYMSIKLSDFLLRNIIWFDCSLAAREKYVSFYLFLPS